MPTYIRIDTSADRAIRARRTLVPSQMVAPFATPMSLLPGVLPGRRWMRVLNYGTSGKGSSTSYVLVGGADVRWPSIGSLMSWGYGLSFREYIDMDIDDDVELFVIAHPLMPAGVTIDIRIIEVA